MRKILLFTFFNCIYNIYAMNSESQLSNFDRELMTKEIFRFDDITIGRIEGYWASSPNSAEDIYYGKFPFPIPNDNPWPGQEEFLAKLKYIQSLATTNPKSRIMKKVYRGKAISRMDRRTKLGRCEFIDTALRIKWTKDFGRYYVKKFNVIPSREFYEYVMSFSYQTDQSDMS